MSNAPPRSPCSVLASGAPGTPADPGAEAALNPTLGRLAELCGLGRTFVQGFGAWLRDERRRRFLDFHAQDGEVVLGHNAPALRQAVEQALHDGLPALVQPYRAACAEQLAAELARQSCLPRCLLTAGREEAVTAALTLARRRSGRPLVVIAHGTAHGIARGIGNGIAPDRNEDAAITRYSPGAADAPPSVARVRFGDLASLATALSRESERTAALVLAPIDLDPDGGLMLPPPDYLRAARELCEAHQVLLIFDETQLGVGRTGRLLAAEHDGVRPDILLLGRGLGGGLFPLAALLCRAEVWDQGCALSPGFAAAPNNLACRVALAVLSELDVGGLCHQVESQGHYLQRQLEALQLRYPTVITAVSGRGLLHAVALQPGPPEPGFFLSYLGGQGLLAQLAAAAAAERDAVLFLPIRGRANWLQLTPPLNITRQEVDLAIQALAAVCQLLAAGDCAALARALGATHPRHLQAAALQKPRLELPLPAVAPPPARSTYAFIFPYPDRSAVLHSDPGLGALSADELRAFTGFAAALPAGVVRRVGTVRSATGAEADGYVLLLPLLPEQLRRLGPTRVLGELQRAVDLAARLGAQVVGLGGTCPEFCQQGLALRGRGPLITTGELLTAVMAVRAVEARRGTDWRGTRVAVLGAEGAVGALCARLVAQRRPAQILLCGSSDLALPPLHTLAAELAVLGPPVQVSASLLALAAYPVIVAASSRAAPGLDRAPLAPGSLLCDLGRPLAVPSQVRARGDLTVIDGGLVALPDRRLRLGAGNLHGIAAGLQQADFAQTLLLGLAGAPAELAVTAAPTLDTAARLAALAAAHGFSLAAPPGDGQRSCRASRARRAGCKKM